MKHAKLFEKLNGQVHDMFDVFLIAVIKPYQSLQTVS